MALKQKANAMGVSKRILIAAGLFSAASMVGAEDVSFLSHHGFEAKGHTIPFSLYTTLTPDTDTRMRIKEVVDLTAVQRNLPGLLSGVLDKTCEHEFALAFAGATADGNRVTAWGQVQAKFYKCDTSDPKVHVRKHLRLSQNVDFRGTATASVHGKCATFKILDLELDLHGVLGAVADLFHLTEKATELILEKGGAALAKHPVCPDLPEGLKGIDPWFSAGGPVEFGDQGLGVALYGSFDISATTMVDIVQYLEDEGKFEEEDK